MDQRLGGNVVEKTLERPDRSALQYYEAKADRPRKGGPLLLFVHGAFSGGWIWSVFFQPYFAKQGYDSIAVDLRGRKSVAAFVPTPHGLSDYVADVEDIMDYCERDVVLVGHSLGGMISQKLSAITRPKALALLASVPPEGLAFSAWQMAFSNPFLFWNTAAFAMSPRSGSLTVARQALLSDDVPASVAKDVLRRSTPEAPRALMEAQMPLSIAPGFLGDTPVMVMGANDDKLIPRSAVVRTAAFYGVEPMIFEDTAHAMMVDTRWQRIADELLSWLDQI